jgi:hypothetical protein
MLYKEQVMSFGLEDFKRGALGRRIGKTIENPEYVRDMIAFCRNGIPAVQAVGRALIAIGPEVADDQVKKTIGRWVREILEMHGWVPLKPGRVAPGNLFTTGMIYQRRAA